ncbi:hypothetical protein [Amycolatopsis xylanica]|nr:hypothetical protein [Amycolatopsis xylanica]
MGVLTAGAVSAGGVAMASPAWAANTASPLGCGLYAKRTEIFGSTLRGYGDRSGCGDNDKVNYLWVRVMKHVAFFPDIAVAVANTTLVSNADLAALGQCAGHGLYYTMTSDSRGNAVESDRSEFC